MIKNKYFKIIIIFILFSLIYILDIYNDLKYGRNLLDVIVRVDCNEQAFNNINSYRISPKNKIDKLFKVNERNIFYSRESGYFKQIKLEIPGSSVKSVNFVEVTIGKTKFEYNFDEFVKQWKYDKSDDSFYSPDSLANSKSIIPIFKNVINWPGDFNFFVSAYFYFFVLFILFILMIYFINRFLNKKIFSFYQFSENENLINKIDKCLFSNEQNKIIYSMFYYFVLIIILAIAFFQRMYYNHMPYADGDVWGYIGPAINFFDKGKFTHISGRSYPYPFFILVILNFFKDFSFIPVIQHVTGLLTAVVFLTASRNCVKLIKYDNKIIITHDLVGLIIISIYLFSDKIIVIEHQLIRESIFPLFLILQVLFLINYLLNIKKNSKLLYYWGILFFINNYFLFVYQPRWGFSLFFCLLIYILTIILIKNKIINKIIFLLIIPFSISFILIYLPEKILIKNETADEVFLAQHLFFGHAKLIDMELEKDLKDNNFNKYNKEILSNVRKAFYEDFNKVQTKHDYLGYDFNRLVYSGWITGFLQDRMSRDEYKNFCIYYFKKTVLKHPIKYLKKVVLELSQFYNFNGQMYSFRSYKEDRILYNETYESLNKSGQITYIPYMQYLNSVEKKMNSFYDLKEINIRLSDVMFFIFSKTYLIILVLFLIIFIYNLILYFKNMILIEEFLLQLFIFCIFLFTFFISLTISTIYTYDVRRYFNDQTIIILFSQMIAIEYLVIYLYKLKKIFIKYN